MRQDKLTTLCKRHHACLLNCDEKMLTIAAVGDPSSELLEALRFATQKRIDIECWTQEQMDSHHQQSAEVQPLLPVEDSGSAVELLDQTLQQALSQRASDIHFEPAEQTYRIRLRVDGVLHALPLVSSALANTLTARLKVLGNLDIAERRLPQDGQFSIALNGQNVSFRIATHSTVPTWRKNSTEVVAAGESGARPPTAWNDPTPTGAISAGVEQTSGVAAGDWPHGQWKNRHSVQCVAGSQ